MSKNVGTIYYEIDAQTGKLLVARSEAVKSLDDIERGAKKTDKSIAKLNTRIKYLARGIQVAIASMAFDALFGYVKQFTQMAEEVKNLSARIALLSKDAATARNTFESLKRISNETGATLADTTSLWEGLTRSLKDAGASNAQILNITSTVQKMGAIGGASAEQMRNAMQQFRQAIDGGTVKAEEFNSIMENTPYVLDQVAKQMGMTKGELRQHMLDGKLSALEMINAIQKSTDQVNSEFDKLPRTSGLAVNQLANEFKTLMAKVDQAFGATDTFVKLIDSSTQTLKVFGEKAYEVGGYVDDIKEGFNDLVNMKNDIVETFGDTGKAIHDAAVEAFALVPGIKHIINGYNMLNDLIQKNGTANKYLQDPITEMTYQLDQAHDVLAKIQDEYNKKNQPKNQDRDSSIIDGKGNGGSNGNNNGNGNGPRTRKPSPYEVLGDTGREAALSLLPKQGALEAFKQEQKALEAAYKQGKIQQEQYQQALLASKTKYHDTLTRINDQQRKLEQERRQQDWNSAVSPEQKALGAIDPIQQIQNEWAIRKQMLLDLGATEATIKEQQLAHEQQLLDLKWQQWQAQSDTNHLIGVMLGGLGDGATNAITGLLNGTQSLKEAFANIGSTILNDVVGAIAEMGMEYIRQQVLGAAQAQASQAATTAATTAQMGTIAAAAAPAAAAVSTATMGGAAGVAMSALSALMGMASSLFGGRRYNGGSVLGGNMYRVGEHGKPELFQQGNKQYMIPGDNGRVISNRNAFGGSQAAPVINNTFNIQTTNGWSDEDSRRLEETVKRISMAQIREQATRPGGIIQRRK